MNISTAITCPEGYYCPEGMTFCCFITMECNNVGIIHAFLPYCTQNGQNSMEFWPL